MELFKGKPLSQVTFDEMCQELTDNEVAEGFFVDYKADFPDRLPKVVASFANHHGGYIFIGIKEDPDKKTASSFDGILKSCDLSEKVRNLIHAHIDPFPLMEVVSIPLPSDSSKAVVIIRVPQSSIAPHICSDGKVYLRNLDASEPADPIKDRYTLDQLYEKSQRMEDALAKRLARTITYERIYGEQDWNTPAPSLSMAFSSIIYPAGVASSIMALDSFQLRNALRNILRGSTNFRTLRGGIAALQNAGGYFSTPTWWKTPDMGIVYEDGLLEIIRHNVARDNLFRLDSLVKDALTNAFKHAMFLTQQAYFDVIRVELHLLGVWGVQFKCGQEYSMYNFSSQCDRGVLKYQFEISAPMLQSVKEWNDAYFPKLFAEAIKVLMSEAGGDVSE